MRRMSLLVCSMFLLSACGGADDQSGKNDPFEDDESEEDMKSSDDEDNDDDDSDASPEDSEDNGDDDNADDDPGSDDNDDDNADDDPGDDDGSEDNDDNDDDEGSNNDDDNGDDDPGDDDSSEDDDNDDDDNGDDDPGDLVGDLNIDRVEVNQGIAVDIWAEGGEVSSSERRAPLVKNRPLLVRAYWKRESNFKAREIQARLTLVQEDGSKETLANNVDVAGDPDKNSLDKTFTWTLSPDQVTAGMQYSISLHEANGEPLASDQRVQARVPESGEIALGIPEDDMHIEIVVVPMVYNGKGPDTSDETLEDIRRNMYRYNAIESDGVKVTLREPIEVSEDNLEHMLDRVTETRMQDNPADHVYYEGVCDSSVAGGGLAWVAGLGSWAAKHRAGASGISKGRTWVVVHETGHNQGMLHNPGCGAAGANEDWPFPDSLIVHQGWDVESPTKLYSGEEYNDYMSYCQPNWLSDFSYRNSGETIVALTQMEYKAWERLTPEREGPVLHGLIAADGRETWSIYPSAMPPLARDLSSTATLRSSSGFSQDIAVVTTEIGHEHTRAVFVALPDSLDTISDIQVNLADKGYRVPIDRARLRYHRLLANQR